MLVVRKIECASLDLNVKYEESIRQGLFSYFQKLELMIKYFKKWAHHYLILLCSKL